jgi:Protein of unknown function (DUF3891)
MMFRDDPNGPIAISQPSHAWLSGQIMRAWGNAEFGSVAPYEDVCLGAEQHDMGWLEWEQTPTLNLTTGRPHGFRELAVGDHTAIWRRGTELALALGRYPALLVSLHGTGLYANFAGAAADVPVVQAFLSGQLAIRQRLLESLGRDQRLGEFCHPAMIERNRGLVRTADRLSIAICTGMQDLAVRSDDPHQGIVRQVPTADGETDILLGIVDGNAESISVAPWPFAALRVQVMCEGTLLPTQKFADVSELRVALRDAARVVLAAELRPG